MIVQGSMTKFKPETVHSEKNSTFFRLVDILVSTPLILIFTPIWLAHFLLARYGGRHWLTKKTAMGRNERPISFWESSTLPKGSFFNRPLIRKSPRLLSVFSGDLGLTGPPMISPKEAQELNPNQKTRFIARPGLLNSYYIKSRANIAFEDERNQAIRDASAGLKTRLGWFLKAGPALLLGSDIGEATPHLTLFGLKMANMTQSQAIDRILELSQGKQPARIAFVNPACINIACKDAQFRQVLEANDEIYPDGIGLQVACKILGRQMKDNLNGTDLFPALCERLQTTEHRVFLLGARQQVVEKVAENIATRYPDLRLCGYRNGYFSKDEAPQIIDQIKQSQADIVLVAMGVPAQETFINQMLPHLNKGVVMGVGGLFDFVSGRIPRAPLWMRETGLEWLYRLIREPKRLWRRYIIGNMVFFWNLARHGK